MSMSSGGGSSRCSRRVARISACRSESMPSSPSRSRSSSRTSAGYPVLARATSRTRRSIAATSSGAAVGAGGGSTGGGSTGGGSTARRTSAGAREPADAGSAAVTRPAPEPARWRRSASRVASSGTVAPGTGVPRWSLTARTMSSRTRRLIPSSVAIRFPGSSNASGYPVTRATIGNSPGCPDSTVAPLDRALLSGYRRHRSPGRSPQSEWTSANVANRSTLSTAPSDGTLVGTMNASRPARVSRTRPDRVAFGPTSTKMRRPSS